jgi:predicted membrane-bound dolichyl-phosphate-mannose-protein mannosyltransferase
MPGSLIGDEVWYVQAARVLAGFPVLMNHLPANAMSGLDPNVEHPPLGKVVLAESMRLLGNREVAWRIPSVVLGTLSIWIFYRIILALRGTRVEALFGAFVLAFDTLFFLHGRIGTLDIYFVTFILVGTWLYLTSYLELAAIAFAVGALCKMNAVLGLLAMFLYEALLARGEWRRPSWRAIGRRAIVVALFLGFFVLGLGALDCFFTRFRSPFDHLTEMGHFHAGLKHTGISSGTESIPFEWWVNAGTFDYYFWNGTTNGAAAHVLFRGMMNGYVIFAAPLALFYAAQRTWKGDSRLATFAVASVVANFVPIFLTWAILSRSSYIYYMLPSLPGIVCALAVALFAVPRSIRWAFLALVLYGFVMTFPFRRF